MNTTLRCLIVAGLAIAVESVTAQAQYQSQWNTPPQSPFYIEGDVGGTLMQHMDLRNLGTKADFDPGVRGSILFGYNIIPPLGFEFETGAIWNRISGNGAQIIGGSFADHGDLYQVPFLGNIVFKAPLPCGLTPYIGAGAGGVASTLALTHNSHHFFDQTSDTDFTFAYQGKAGLKYALGWNMEVGVGYEFLGTLDHRWFGDDPNLIVKSGPAYSHSILATFTWHF